MGQQGMQKATRKGQAYATDEFEKPPPTSLKTHRFHFCNDTFFVWAFVCVLSQGDVCDGNSDRTIAKERMMWGIC